MHTNPTHKIPQVDIPSIDSNDVPQEYSFEELLAALEDSTSQEIIIRIPQDQLYALTTGLQNKKAKKTYAAKKKGLDFGKYTLKFNNYPDRKRKEFFAYTSSLKQELESTCILWKSQILLYRSSYGFRKTPRTE